VTTTSPILSLEKEKMEGCYTLYTIKKSKIDVEFKINALKTIKQNYPFLLK
jgi:hypothetical protein